MSQQEIARAAGVNQATVSRMEGEFRRRGVLVWRSADGEEIPADQAPKRLPGERDYPCPVREIRWTRELLEVRCERPGWRRRIDLAMALLSLPVELRPAAALVLGCLCRRPIANGDAALEAWYAGAVRRQTRRREREERAVAEALERRQRAEDERTNQTIVLGLLARYRPEPAGLQPKCIGLGRGDSTSRTSAGGLSPNRLRAGTRSRTAVGAAELRLVVADGLVPDVSRAAALAGELGRAAATVGERNPRSLWVQLANLARRHAGRSLDELVGLYGRAVICTRECAERAATGRRSPVENPAAFAAGVVRRALRPAA